MRLNHKTLPVVLLLLVGGGLTAALVGFATVASRMQRTEALVQQRDRADDLAAQFDALLAASEQVAHTLAELVPDARTPQELERLMRRTFASTPPESVYGIGVFFAPYRFAPGQRYMGPYIHRGPGHAPVLTYEWSTSAYDYPHQPWYQGALARGGQPFYTDPYWDNGMVYQSITRTFTDARGQLLGVVSVDASLPQLQRLVTHAPQGPGSTAYVTAPSGALIAHPHEADLLAWARSEGLPVRALTDLRAEDLRHYERAHGLDGRLSIVSYPLRRAGWQVHVVTDKALLFRGVHRLRVAVVLCGVALWGGLLAAAFAMRRSLRVHTLSRELAAQEHVRRTLAASERKLRQVLQTALDGVVAVDARGLVVEWNARAEEIFGWRKDEVLGRPAAELLLPAWERERRRSMGLTLSPEAFHGEHLEVVGVRRGGEEFPVELRASAVDADGERLLYAFFNDITERRRKDEQLQRLLAQLRQRTAELDAVLDNMVDGVLVASPGGALLLINAAAREVLGLRPGEEARLQPDIVSRYGLQTVDGQPHDFESLPLVRALRGEVVHDAHLRIAPESLGGRYRIIRSSAAPIRDEAGRVVAAVSVARDVTEAMELDRLKNEFLRVAAHELKTPVAVMKSFAQLALKTARELPPALRRQLDGISRGADRLDQVIRTLLDASQAQLGSLRLEPRELPLRALVESAAARTAAQHPGHVVRVRPGPDAHVRADGERLGQVLLELLDNAARYSPAGSTVEVSLVVEGTEAEVAIRDEGVGIPREHQARIFERFYRAHSGTPHDRGGMGLGLFLAREILRVHGGRILLESEQGRGTTVRVRLPRLPEAHAARGPEGARSESSPPPR